jgi:hypothetical protein
MLEVVRRCERLTTPLAGTYGNQGLAASIFISVKDVSSPSDKTCGWGIFNATQKRGVFFLVWFVFSFL